MTAKQISSLDTKNVYIYINKHIIKRSFLSVYAVFPFGFPFPFFGFTFGLCVYEFILFIK